MSYPVHRQVLLGSLETKYNANEAAVLRLLVDPLDDPFRQVILYAVTRYVASEVLSLPIPYCGKATFKVHSKRKSLINAKIRLKFAITLTHLSLAPHKWDIVKQRRPR